MTLPLLRFTAWAWIRSVFSTEAVTALLSSFGALWLVVEVTSFYFEETAIPDWLRHKWWLFAIGGIIIALCRCRPRTSVEHKLNGRDVTVAIGVGDLFRFPGALIIGGNTTFDTQISPRMISEKSVQGAFTRKYYADELQLDNEISLGLPSASAETLAGQRQGKYIRYPLGTVVRLNPKGRTAYLVAIADINEHGVAQSSFERLQVALAELWLFVGSRGLKEPLIMPVLGTGFSRLPQTREEVIREIVKSFVAACSERVFTDRLTIVVSPTDMAQHRVPLVELGAFLRHTCVYAEYAGDSHRPSGIPIMR